MLKRKMPPSHPGEVLQGLYLEPLGVNITDAAKKLGITRKTLSLLVNGHMGISPEMSLRLAKALKTTPELWLNLQRNYDLWFAEKTFNASKISYIRNLHNEDVRVI
jgi:antitoxin HigA-1